MEKKAVGSRKGAPRIWEGDTVHEDHIAASPGLCHLFSTRRPPYGHPAAGNAPDSQFLLSSSVLNCLKYITVGFS